MVMNHLVPPRTPEQLTTPLDLQRESLMRSSDARRKCTPSLPYLPFQTRCLRTLYLSTVSYTLYFPYLLRVRTRAHTHKKAGGVRKAW